MAQSKLELKLRIKSIDSTKKITKAMQLVASAKFQKQKQKMQENKEYALYFQMMIGDIVSNLRKNENIFVDQHEGEKDLYIVYNSDMGLCGAYNANVHRLIKNIDPKDSEFIVFGQRGRSWFRSQKQYNVKSFYSNLPSDCYHEIQLIVQEVFTLYTKGYYRNIYVVYSEFINSVSFEAKVKQVLPIQHERNKTITYRDVIFEPSKENCLEYIVEMFLTSFVYSCFLESSTSEQASRRSAMETASDNAQELKEMLELKFNQARQASITQEITEIVSGANAL